MERPGPVEDQEVLSGPDGDQQHGLDVIIMFAVFFEGGLAPLSLFLGWWLGQNPLAHFSWDLMAALWGALGTLPLAAFFLLMLHRPVGPFRRIKEFCENEFVPLLSGCSWSDMALIALSAAVGEEMLFRGVLQSSLSNWLGVGWGLSLASLCFGLLHPISLPYVMFTMMVGLYFGMTFVLTGNLLAVMVTHALYDFALMAYLLKRNPVDPPGEIIRTVDDDENIDD